MTSSTETTSTLNISSGTTGRSLDDFAGLAVSFSLLSTHPLFQATMLLYRISLPVIISVGVVGNTLILIVHRRLEREGQGSSLSVLISSLAVSDSVMLVVSGLTWFLAFTFQIAVSDFHDVSCKLVFWIVYVTGETSPWMLVVMTMQRALSILWPHKAGALWTVRTGRWTVGIIVVVAMLLNAHIFYGRLLQLVPVTEERLCLFVSDKYYFFYEKIWLSVDITISSFLPFLLIIASNLVLVSKVRQSMREARENLTAGNSDQLQARKKKTSSMTLLLICVSITFLLLTSPLCVFSLLQRTGGHVIIRDLDEAARNYLIETIGNIMWLSNHAVNFYIYLVTGSRYRTALLAWFPCCQQSRRG